MINLWDTDFQKFNNFLRNPICMWILIVLIDVHVYMCFIGMVKKKMCETIMDDIEGMKDGM